MVQLREKGGDINEIKWKARQLQQVLNPFGIPLIINDFVKLAAEINAAGVHIGQHDMNPKMARNILGPGKMIGLSIESMEDLERSNQMDEIDYVTASAIWPSKTKPDCKKMWGIAGLHEVVRYSRHPVTAIGGIKLHNAAEIIATGAVGIAVIGAIHDAERPYEATLALNDVLARNLMLKRAE